MNHLTKLTDYLKDNRDTDYFIEVRKLIRQRILEMDETVPKLLNKAFNHRYIISRIEKTKREGKKDSSGKEPDYNAQLLNQYRQIHWIQGKINQLKMEYGNLKKMMIAIHLLNNYHLEVNAIPISENENKLDEDLQAISLKYLYNNEYEQMLINRYTAGLIKEGLELWGIKSLDDIKG
jgi:hypothetical protein